jgi:HPt (histidine-containing phosphotransfer) domain-containing protein
MDSQKPQNILVKLSKHPEIRDTLQAALSDAVLNNYDPLLVNDATALVTDTGIENGEEIPGFIPVVVIHDEDDERILNFYTHELSPDERPDTFQTEFRRFSEIADISHSLLLKTYPILNYEKLDELVAIGGYGVVRSGMDQFVRNTTLQLNECAAVIPKQDYDFVRYTLHAMNNNANNIGAEQLAVFCRAMEDALVSENYPNFEAMLDLAYMLLASFEYVSRSWTDQPRMA